MPVLESTLTPLERRLPVIKADRLKADRLKADRLKADRPKADRLKADRPTAARLKAARAAVEKAVQLKKVFSVQGPYPVIRTALWARGWVERCLSSPVQRALYCHSDEKEDDGSDGDVSADVNERVGEVRKEENLSDMYDFMSHLVRNETTYFYWTVRRDSIDCHALQNDQMTNHFATAGTFTKVGLCMNLRKLKWFDAADPDTFFPRCYRLGAEDEKQTFIEDFRRTACTSLLQHVVETSHWWTDKEEGQGQKAKDRAPDELYDMEHQFVGPEIIHRALQVCQEFLCVLKHSDIDVTAESTPTMEEQQWKEFLRDYYKVVHGGAVIRGSSVLVECCQAMLASLQEVCPQLDIDGLNNIWIIKPGAMSRGRGIVCMNRLDKILALVDADRTLVKENKWVVQKYLERPLLVHGTKFDLRQWFLVTDWNPLTVWFYKECYLRFSTQPFSTKTLDSSVHLCNNSIQKHCQPSWKRQPGVPDDNMWSYSQFCSFLQQQGRKEKWQSVVVPGMQQAIVHALQTAQDQVKSRKASFELYGADFMLDRDLRPWLLEINVSPTMASSTAVTAQLCPAVQVDTLRVVLDRQIDPDAYTGGFQLIYKQAAIEVPHYMGLNLMFHGVPLLHPRPVHRKRTVSSKPPLTVHVSTEQPSPGEVEERRKLSGQKPHMEAAYNPSGKQTKERRTPGTSTSPKRQHEIRAGVQNGHCVLRFCKKPLRVHPEDQTKVQQFGSNPRVNKATLVPKSLSFSLSPPQISPEGKLQLSARHGSRIARSFLPQTSVETQRRISTQVCPSIQGSLPRLCYLRPNTLTETTLCHNLAVSSYSNVHKHQLFPKIHKDKTLDGTKNNAQKYTNSRNEAKHF